MLEASIVNDGFPNRLKGPFTALLLPPCLLLLPLPLESFQKFVIPLHQFPVENDHVAALVLVVDLKGVGESVVELVVVAVLEVVTIVGDFLTENLLVILIVTTVLRAELVLDLIMCVGVVNDVATVQIHVLPFPPEDSNFMIDGVGNYGGTLHISISDGAMYGDYEDEEEDDED